MEKIAENGYPTEEELNLLRNFRGSLEDFLSAIKSCWTYANSNGFILKGKSVLRLKLNTFGWSGNETIVAVLEHTYFWLFCWEKSTRGGHYWFRIKKKQIGSFDDWGLIKKH